MQYKSYINIALILSCLNLSTVQVAEGEQLEELIKQCGTCHGLDGNSMMSMNPSIAGMTKEYFLHTIDAYKNDGRHSDMMKMFVHSLSDEQANSLAEYFERQTFVPRDQKFDTQKAEKGKALHEKYCEKCHEQAGKITENNYGFLAGQWTPYLKKIIQDYVDKKRNAPPMMITKLQKMKSDHGEESIDWLMHFYASQK